MYTSSVRQAIQGRKEQKKRKQNTSLRRNKDSITKNMERFGQCYAQYFPASTVVNAGIPGNTVEEILYGAETMIFILLLPYFVEQTINLLFNTPDSFVATIIEILFVLRKKCPIFIYFLICHSSIAYNHKYTPLTLLSFQIQDLFSHSVVFHDLPSSLFNRNVYRKH